jgi:DNA-binding protein HU-beta
MFTNGLIMAEPVLLPNGIICVAKTDLSKSKANEYFNVVLEITTKVLSKGDTVPFTGFGTFSVKKRVARKGRNPQTGEAIKIAARKVVHFSTGKKLKDAVNKR